MSDRPVRPSAYFGYGDQAVAAMCRGCPHENGWVDLVNERDPVCPNMLAIQDDVVGSIVSRDRRLVCPKRPDRRRGKRSEKAPDEQMRLF